MEGPFSIHTCWGEAHLHDDVDVKEALNKILQTIVSTSAAYALV
jgi:hypothetical protein